MRPDTPGTGDDVFYHRIVLDIPVPREVQALPKRPPVCVPTMGDAMAVELLRGYGNGRGINEKEVAQACSLAAGLSDIVVLLERPRAKTYNVDFDEFVKDSKTLRAVDDLVRFASKGARSIHTVTVVDAFSFQEDKSYTKFDQECHMLLAQFLQAKKPKVVIRCHRDRYKHEWMKRFESPGEDYRLERKEIEIERGYKTVVLQSFHPSCAVNNADYRPEYRALLIHHFVAAFGELHGEGQLPACAEDLRELCQQKGNRTSTPYHKFHSARRNVSLTLSARYNDPFKSISVGFGDLERSERIMHNAKAHLDMYHWFRRLAQGSRSPGSLALSRIYLFNWKEFFTKEPLYKQVTWLLEMSGTKQASWIAPKSRLDDDDVVLSNLTTKFNELTFDDGKEPIGGVVGNRIKLIESMRRITNKAKEYLHKSSITELAVSLQIAGLVAYGGDLLEIFDKDGYITEKGDGGLAADIMLCDHYLSELKGLVEGRIVT